MYAGVYGDDGAGRCPGIVCRRGSFPEKNLYAPGSSREWLLPRINPVCENCAQNKTHQVVMEYHSIILFVKLSKRYHLICSECSEKIELDYGEYLKIKPYLEK